jgi:site-specific DNA recombinase
MSNAAIYARVSSARQKEQATIGSQTAALHAHAEQLGLDVPAQWVFCDDGHSGATLVRPALEKLRDLVAQVPVEVVLVYSPDRLARKYAYQALLIEEFAKAGTSVVFVNGPSTDSPEDALLVQFQGMIAEYERAQIIERTRRGKTHRARQGTVNVLSGRRSATGTFARTSMPTPATRSSRTRRRLWLSCSAAMSRTARRSPAWPGG